MTPPLVLTDRALIEAALTNPALVPHGLTSSSDGSTVRLRDAMARFSDSVDHGSRRHTVVELIGRLDVEKALTTAAALTDDALAEGADVPEVARTVPTRTMARLLDLSVDSRVLLADVEAVVAVIGRGEPPTAGSDDAADRLLRLAVGEEHDPVALVSVLYQNFDSTTAAILSAEQARRSGGPPVPAVARTRRVAHGATRLGPHLVEVGDDVTLEIGAADLPFGFGPHECPGRTLAESIVAGVISVLDSARLIPRDHSTDRTLRD